MASKRFSRGVAAAALGAMTAMLAPAQAASADVLLAVWEGGVDVWANPFAWSGGVVPNNGLDTWEVLIPGGQATTTTNYTVDDIGVLPGAALVIGNSTFLNMIGDPGDESTGGLSNQGDVYLNSTGNVTILYIQNGELRLGNSKLNPGTLHMSEQANNRIQNFSGTSLLHNQSPSTIRGAGNIGVNSIGLRNDGVIEAIYASTPLIIDPSPTVVENRGLLRAIDGATLQLNPAIYQNLDLGQIHALAGSTVSIAGGAEIRESTLESFGNGQIVVDGNTVELDRCEIIGTLNIPNSIDPRFVDTLDITGEVNLNSTGSVTILYCDNEETGGLVIAGNGVINMSPDVDNRIQGWNSNELLTIDLDEIRGSGQIGVNSLSIINNTAITADQAAASMRIDPINLTNNGAIRARNGALLQLAAGTYDNTNGVVEAEADSLIEIEALNLNDGVLRSLPAAGPAAPGEFVITANTATLLDVTLDAILTVPNSIDPRFQDSLVNERDIYVESTGSVTIVYIDNVVTDGVQLSGGGTVHLSDDFNNRIQGWNSNETLHNVDNTLRGSGQIGVNSLSVVNDGMFLADQTAPMQFDVAGGGLENNGVLRADLGGTLRLTGGAYDNVDGVIEILNGSTFDLDGGVVTNTGNVINLLDGSGGTFSNSFGLIGGELFGDPGTQIAVTGATGLIEDLTTNVELTMTNTADVRWSDEIVNTGVINLASAGGTTIFYVDNNATGGVRLSGGGVVNLSDNVQNRFQGWNSNETFENVDNTIRGAGQIGLNSLPTIINSGLIMADLPTSLTIDPGAACLNFGELRASGDGVLRLINADYDGMDVGLIQAVGGGLVEITAPTIRNMTISADADSAVRVVGSTPAIQDCTINGLFEMTNPVDVRYLDSIHNTGVIEMQSTGGVTIFYVDNLDTDGVQLTGGGTILMSDTIQNRFQGWNSNETLTNVDNTIRGSGQLGLNSLRIVNGGTIWATDPTGMTLDPSSPVNFVNTGVLRVSPGSSITSVDDLIQTDGMTLNEGTFTLNPLRTFFLEGGELTGVGMTGDVDNTGGVLDPGVSGTGEFALDGEYDQSGDGALEILLNGLAPITEHDVLNVTETVTLGGTLQVVWDELYMPKLGDSWTIITAADILGEFVAVEGPGGYEVTYNETTVVLTLTSVSLPCPQDLDGNEVVGPGDLATLLAAWGPNRGNPADFDDDGMVGASDLAALLAAWGECP